MNLILGIGTGDGFQDGFEGSKCFGWTLREFDRKCNTPKTPINPPSLLNWVAVSMDCGVTRAPRLTPRPPRPDQVISVSTILSITKCTFRRDLWRLLNTWTTASVLPLITRESL